MNLVLLLSIVIQFFALAWSLVLLKRLRDWRLVFLTAMLGLMLVRPGMALFPTGNGLAVNHLADLPALAVSALAAISVVFVGQMLADRARVGEESAATTRPTQAEHGLREATDILQLIFQASPLPLAVLGCDQKVKLWSPAAERFFGWSASEVIGQSLPIIPEEEWEAFQGMINAESRGVDRQGLELRRRKRDGSPIHVSLWTACLRDAQGRVQAILGVFTDITERKRVQEAAEAGERRFRSLIENSLDGIVLSQPDGTCAYVSPSITRILGYASDEFVGHKATEFMHPEEIAETLRALELFLQTPGNTNRLQHRMRHKDGSWRWMEVVATNLLADPAVQAIVVNFHDITESRLAEERLRESRERFELAVRGATDGVWDWNLVTGDTYVSDRWCELLEYRRDEIPDAASLNQWVFAQIHPDDLDRVHDAVRQHWVLREPYGVEFRMPTKSGEYRWFYSCGQAAWNQQGQTVRFAGCLTDITERRRAEEDLKASRTRLESLSRQLLTTQENERQTLARELHDEIGQTLTAMRMLCETGTCPAGPRVLGLVTELMGRVRNLSFDLRPPMLDPLGLLPTLLWTVERFSARTKIRVAFRHSEIERRFAPELEIAVFRIIQEALTNVARHAGVDELTVQLWAENEALGIQVTDRGKGFDPTAVLTGRSTGGLTGIEERVKLLGGELAIESAPGQGTFLTVQFPLDACSKKQEGEQ